MKHLTLFATFCVSLAPTSLSDSAVVVMVAEGSSASNLRSTSTQSQSDRRNAEHTNVVAPPSSSTRRKRSVFHLFNMMTCATTCNPLNYKGYGCYCGFLGSGVVVDGIDKCCKGHDWCYEHARCKGLDHYITPYKWKCNGGKPYCVTRKSSSGAVDSCGHQLCECDREFVECLKQYPCPKSKAMCTTSPWRYWQNLFMGMISGMGMHKEPHDEEHQQPSPTDHHHHQHPVNQTS